jgi:hypothetical protein
MDNKNTAQSTRKNLTIVTAVFAVVLAAVLIIVLLVIAARPGNNPAPQPESPVASSPVVSTPAATSSDTDGVEQPGASNSSKQLSEKLGEVKIELTTTQDYKLNKVNLQNPDDGSLQEEINIEGDDVKLQLKLATGGLGGVTSLANKSDYPQIQILRDVTGNNLQRRYDSLDKNDITFPFVASYSTDGYQDLCGEVGLGLDPEVEKMCASAGELFYPASTPGILVYSQDSSLDDGSDATVFVTCYAKSIAGFDNCDQLVKTLKLGI